MLPPDTIVGLRSFDETYEHLGNEIDGVELDCVSHDIGKYLRLLTRKNGYVLEQIFSPLVVHDGGRLPELHRLARGAITRQVAHRYRGFHRSPERGTLEPDERDRLMNEAAALAHELEGAAEASPLPESVENMDELHAFLVALQARRRATELAPAQRARRVGLPRRLR